MEHTETILEQHYKQMFKIYEEMSDELKEQIHKEIDPNVGKIKSQITHTQYKLNLILDSWDLYTNNEYGLERLKQHLKESLKAMNTAQQIPINTSTIQANNNAMKKMADGIKTS